MKKNFILLCSLLASFTLQPTKTGAQTAANGQKMTYPYTFAPSEGLVNKTEKRASSGNLPEWILGFSACRFTTGL